MKNNINLKNKPLIMTLITIMKINIKPKTKTIIINIIKIANNIHNSTIWIIMKIIPMDNQILSITTRISIYFRGIGA